MKRKTLAKFFSLKAPLRIFFPDTNVYNSASLVVYSGSLCANLKCYLNVVKPWSRADKAHQKFSPGDFMKHSAQQVLEIDFYFMCKFGAPEKKYIVFCLFFYSMLFCPFIFFMLLSIFLLS